MKPTTLHFKSVSTSFFAKEIGDYYNVNKIYLSIKLKWAKQTTEARVLGSRNRWIEK